MSAIDDLAKAVDPTMPSQNYADLRYSLNLARHALAALRAEHARTRDVLAPDQDTTDTPLDELAKAALHARQFDDEWVVKFADGPEVPVRGRQSAINYAEAYRAVRVEHRGGDVVWEAEKL